MIQAVDDWFEYRSAEAGWRPRGSAATMTSHGSRPHHQRRRDIDPTGNPNRPAAPTRLASGSRHRPLHGMRLVRGRVRAAPAQPRRRAVEKVFDAARCRSVHGLQRLRGGVPVSRDHDAPGL